MPALHDLDDLDDLDVIKRDPTLPGLEVLLDSERMQSVLRRLFPEYNILGLSSSYLKYKPQTNCLAGFVADTPTGLVRITAKTYSKQEYNKIRAKFQQEQLSGQIQAAQFFLDEWLLVVWPFPWDKKITGLADVADPERLKALLSTLLPDKPELWQAQLDTLCYKPERRYVGKLSVAGQARALIKIYADDFKNARKAAETVCSFPASKLLTVSRPMGLSRDKQIIISQWLPGRPLRQELFKQSAAGRPDTAQLRAVGRGLAAFHQQKPGLLAKGSLEHDALAVLAAAGAAAFLLPSLSQRLRFLAAGLAAELLAYPTQLLPIHGDFSADQVLVSPKDIAIIDYDQARLGDPAADFGSFIAQLLYDEATDNLESGCAKAITQAFMAGYFGNKGTGRLPARTDLYLSVKLLQLVPQVFRERHPNWAGRMEFLLQHAETHWNNHAKNINANTGI